MLAPSQRSRSSIKKPRSGQRKTTGRVAIFLQRALLFAVIAIDMTFLQAVADPGRSVGSVFSPNHQSFQDKTQSASPMKRQQTGFFSAVLRGNTHEDVVYGDGISAAGIAAFHHLDEMVPGDI